MTEALGLGATPSVPPLAFRQSLMATTEAAVSESHHDSDHEHGHDHPAFLAHHFETPEQQFDSGKLGMWLFLVTEVLFFSGMFCAYAIYRMMRPEVFEGCSQFLNTQLGAVNTGVLLFSSLTMAWAVRCAQTEEHKKQTALLASTLSCAMIFLGVKAIEYSHKWHLGLLPPAWFSYNPANPHPEGGEPYLLYLSAPFAIGLVAVLVWLVVAKLKDKPFQVAVMKPLTVVFACFFVGVGLGTLLESGADTSDSHAAVAHDEEGHEAAAGHGEHGSEESAESGAEHAPQSAEGSAAAAAGASEVAADHPPEAAGDGQQTAPAATGGAAEPDSRIDPVLQRLAADPTNTGLKQELRARRAQADVAGTTVVTDQALVTKPITDVPQVVLTPSRAGVFFGIYYCMTGIHAIHILGGIGVLIWLLVRSVRQDFSRQYFGPVDYVGLYWHLVDLIWIYLFPLLYLIR